MKKEIAELWAAALESGDYVQGKGTLTRVSGFDGTEKDCCLGVLCKVAVANGVPLTVEHKDGYTVYDGTEAVLPLAVQKWAGVENADPKCPGSGAFTESGVPDPTYTGGWMRSFSSVNDGFGVKFPQLAQIIRDRSDEIL